MDSTLRQDDENDSNQKSIEQLNALYKEAEAVDKSHFSECRVNILLVAGEHFSREGSRYWRNDREPKSGGPDQKIRITKNHMGRIAKLYCNFILSANPGVVISAKQEKEIQHQKIAEMHSSVAVHLKDKHEMDRKKFLWCKDYIEQGEVAVKVFFDLSLGRQVGWEPVVDEAGNPVMDPNSGEVQIDPATGGQVVVNQTPLMSDTPIMSGDLVFETIHPFDLLRKAGVKSMEESPFLIIRKMEDVKDLMKKFGKDEEKAKFIKESKNDTFRVFKPDSGWSDTKGMTMVREYYFKPCAAYPEGYYYISTEMGTLAEGVLPYGVYPIHYLGFDEMTTNPRAKSILRQLKPYQVELNKTASKISEIQSTLGSDRVWYQAGSKPSSGASKPGIRENSYTGAPPIVIPGSAGEQYMGYMAQTIAEMYQVADLAEFEKDTDGQLDPYALLFRSMKQKQKFSFYSDKFNGFQIKVWKTALQLYKKYVHPTELIPVIGKNEQVNIEEFKSANDLMYEIKVESMSDDIESKLGKQLSLNHYLQYVGPQLKPEDIGKMIRLSPYLNMEKMFQNMTQDYDNLNNDIISLDRARFSPANKYDKHDYVIAGLISRMKQPDFEFLPPQVQQMYEAKLQQHEQILAQQQEEIKRAQAGFIPSGGYLVTTDFYIENADSTKKPDRARVPSEALDWLIKNLQTQGTGQKMLENIGNTQAIAEIAQMIR